MKGLLFTYLLTYGGALASLVRPYYGLLVYVCFAIVKPDLLWHWSVPQGNYSRIVALAMAAGWLISGFGDKRFGPARAIVGCFAGFGIWLVVSGLFAPDSDVAFAAIEQYAKILLPILVGATVVRTPQQLRGLLWTIVASQTWIALEMNLSYLQGYNQLQFEGFAGMDNNSVAIALVTALGVAFVTGLRAATPGRAALAFGMTGILAHAVLISFSRGGMLAAAACGAAAFLVVPRTTRVYVVFGLALLATLRLAGPEVRGRLMSSFEDRSTLDVSAQSRLELWEDCVDATLSHPVFGVGPDHWPLVAHTYGWPRGKEAHSLWFQTAAELGFPGIAMLLGAYVLTILRCLGLIRSAGRRSRAAGDRDGPSPRPDERAGETPVDIARMTIPGLVGFGIAAQFVSLEALEIPYYVALLGACAVLIETRRRATEDVSAVPFAAELRPESPFRRGLVPETEVEVPTSLADTLLPRSRRTVVLPRRRRPGP